MATIFFNAADGIRLEAVFQGEKSSPAAVITHPHPLFGGTMNNYVVEAMADAFLEAGYAALRFNFRGVGNSGGRRSADETCTSDVAGALDYIREIGSAPALLAGYSFGTWVNAHLPAKIQPPEMVMISPPVAMMDFSAITALPTLTLAVTGEHDEIAPPELIRQRLALWNPEAHFRIIENGDHFFGASLRQLKSILKETRDRG